MLNPLYDDSIHFTGIAKPPESGCLQQAPAGDGSGGYLQQEFESDDAVLPGGCIEQAASETSASGYLRIGAGAED